MIYIMLGGLVCVVLLIVFLVWLRKSGSGLRIDQLIISLQPTNPVRVVALEGIPVGILGILLAVFDRIDGPRGELRGLALADQINYLLLLLAGYILICAVAFLIWPGRVGFLFLGLGIILVGGWNLFVVAMAYLGARIELFQGGLMEMWVNQYPWIVALVSVLLIVAGVYVMSRFFKRELTPITTPP